MPNRLTISPGVPGVLAGCACVATAVLVSKPIVEHLPVLPVVLLQIVASILVTWPMAFLLRLAPSAQSVVAIGWPGLLQPGLAYMLTFAGLAITPASVEGLLFAFEAALVALFAWPLLGERPSRRTVAVLAIGTVGVLFVSGADSPGAAPPVLGVLLILAGVAAAALDTVASRHLAVSVAPLTLTAGTQVAGLAAVAASAPFWKTGDLATVLSSSAALPIFVSGVLVHGIAPWMFNASLKTLTAGAAAALFPLISLLTVLGGVVFLAETLSALQVVGGVLVVASAIAAARGAKG